MYNINMKTLEGKNKLIGQKIKEAREHVGVSQKKIANVLGFESSTAVSLIEAGERRLKIEDLEKIANFLGKDIKFFLGIELETEEAPNIKYALRADNDLSKDEQDEILRFIDFVKNSKNGRTKK